MFGFEHFQAAFLSSRSEPRLSQGKMKANFGRLKRHLVCIIQQLRLHRKEALSLYF